MLVQHTNERNDAAVRLEVAERLSLMSIFENASQGKLSASAPAGDGTPATVEVRPPGPFITSGSVTRWVPNLTVAMPIGGTGRRRNLVHVW